MKPFSSEFLSAVLRDKPVVGRMLESVSEQRKGKQQSTPQFPLRIGRRLLGMSSDLGFQEQFA
jgi:hypothetical protein